MTVFSSQIPECGFCGNPYHKACFHCHRPGVPYVYHDITFDGLIARRGEQLCPACAEAAGAAEGINILVVDDRPGVPDFVYNTVRDRDLAIIRVAPEDRGIDGRDAFHRGRRNKRGALWAAASVSGWRSSSHSPAGWPSARSSCRTRAVIGGHHE